jgi:hypothetical protein
VMLDRQAYYEESSTYWKEAVKALWQKTIKHIWSYTES